MASIEAQSSDQVPNRGSLDLPPMEEIEEYIMAGEQMIRDFQQARKGKLLRTDPEVNSIVIRAHKAEETV